MHTVLPSPSAQSGILYLRKISRSLWFRFPAPSPVSMTQGPHSAKAAWFSPPTPPKLCGPLSLLHQSCLVLSQVWLPHLGLNPSASLPLQPWSRVQPRGGPQEGICNGVQDSGCPGNIRKMYIGWPHPHRPEPGGMGHMEQGHSELFCTATAVQLTSGMVL